jgi:hypothetical protein
MRKTLEKHLEAPIKILLSEHQFIIYSHGLFFAKSFKRHKKPAF